MADGTGAQVREVRLARGMRQAALAAEIGISPSYLNLIEHGRRPVPPQILARIAKALGVPRRSLAGAPDPALLAAVEAAAAAAGTVPATDEPAVAFVRRFPGWAELVATMARDAARDAERIAALSDRLAHDPVLADGMHELLTAAAGVRSMASILARTPRLEPSWLERFHANVDAESRRLAAGTKAIVAHLDRQAAVPSGSPLSAARRALAEATGERADMDFAGLAPEAREIAAAYRLADAVDAERAPAAALVGSPAAVAARLDVPMSLVLRRLAATNAGRGLVVCDASGAILRHVSQPGFPVPDVGAGCPLWPLYAALSRPMQPVRETVIMPDGGTWRADAICEAVAATPHGPVLQATMIVARAVPEGSDAPLAVGPTCRICPRSACPARREPSLIAAGAGAALDTARARGETDATT